ERALTPRTGEARRQVMRATVLGIALANKARLQMYELLFRPEELRHPPLRARLHGQMLAAAAELDKLCAAQTTPYLFGDRITQADISLGCAFTYATETVGLEPPLPALRARAARLAELPVFREIYLPFDAPAV
ncbi:MAG TPA: glutathione S-transferase C-terminal domain-containing protein, partial [Kofleriaceae bacterium]|nr:glutathione S-transferase C-terminal domain-containing protein [Kofleriaceae bacterium]